MAVEVPGPRRGEPVASWVVREDGQPDLFIDVYEHPEFSAEPDVVDADEAELLAEAESGWEGMS